MAERSVARDADIELAGVCLRVRRELLDILDRKRRPRRDDQGRLGQQHDRRESLLRIVRHALVHQLVVRERPGRAEQDRVAVGSGFGDGSAPDIAACAGTIVDDELLAKSLAEILRERTRQQVGAPAGGKRHDHGDGPRRPDLYLCLGDRRSRPEASGGDGKRDPSSDASFHDVLPCRAAELRRLFLAAPIVLRTVADPIAASAPCGTVSQCEISAIRPPAHTAYRLSSSPEHERKGAGELGLPYFRSAVRRSTLINFDDVVVEQPDTARRHSLVDRMRFISPVRRKRVSWSPGTDKAPALPERVFNSAWHAARTARIRDMARIMFAGRGNRPPNVPAMT